MFAKTGDACASAALDTQYLTPSLERRMVSVMGRSSNGDTSGGAASGGGAGEWTTEVNDEGIEYGIGQSGRNMAWGDGGVHGDGAREGPHDDNVCGLGQPGMDAD